MLNSKTKKIKNKQKLNNGKQEAYFLHAKVPISNFNSNQLNAKPNEMKFIQRILMSRILSSLAECFYIYARENELLLRPETYWEADWPAGSIGF